jgi:ABC-type uncharacterized transport system ATPase subunit
VTPTLPPDGAPHRTAAVVLRVAGLRKSYGGSEAVRGLDFSFRRGECFGLLGPNGAGKTATLRCRLGRIDPDGGTIELLGEPEVIEVCGDDAKAWADAHGRRLSTRLELAGDTAFRYATDPGLAFARRRATLRS